MKARDSSRSPTTLRMSTSTAASTASARVVHGPASAIICSLDEGLQPVVEPVLDCVKQGGLVGEAGVEGADRQADAVDHPTDGERLDSVLPDLVLRRLQQALERLPAALLPRRLVWCQLLFHAAHYSARLSGKWDKKMIILVLFS